MTEYVDKITEYHYMLRAGMCTVAIVVERNVSFGDECNFRTLNYGFFYDMFNSFECKNYNSEAKVELKYLSALIDEYVECNDLYVCTFDDKQPKFEMWVKE